MGQKCTVMIMVFGPTSKLSGPRSLRAHEVQFNRRIVDIWADINGAVKDHCLEFSLDIELSCICAFLRTDAYCYSLQCIESVWVLECNPHLLIK